jgi:hypothetical protein
MWFGFRTKRAHPARLAGIGKLSTPNREIRQNAQRGPLFLFYAAESEFVGHDGPRVDPTFAEMTTSRSSSPKKRQPRPQSEENGSSQSSAGRMDPVFQTLLNPFRHRKDSSKLFTDRKFAHGSLTDPQMCMCSI